MLEAARTRSAAAPVAARAARRSACSCSRPSGSPSPTSRPTRRCARSSSSASTTRSSRITTRFEHAAAAAGPGGFGGRPRSGPSSDVRRSTATHDGTTIIATQAMSSAPPGDDARRRSRSCPRRSRCTARRLGRRPGRRRATSRSGAGRRRPLPRARRVRGRRLEHLLIVGAVAARRGRHAAPAADDRAARDRGRAARARQPAASGSFSLGLRPLRAIEADRRRDRRRRPSRRVERAEERTEVGRLGLALNAMLGQIETAFKAREASERKLRRFVADASHELRTPLAAVRAYAELFDARRRPPPRRPRARDDGHHARVRAHEPARPGSAAARAARRGPAARARARSPRRGRRRGGRDRADGRARTGRSTSTPRTAVVLGDRDRLRQIVDNLLGNVRAHTPPETPVHVTRRPRQRRRRDRGAGRGPGPERRGRSSACSSASTAPTSRARARAAASASASRSSPRSRRRTAAASPRGARRRRARRSASRSRESTTTHMELQAAFPDADAEMEATTNKGGV